MITPSLLRLTGILVIPIRGLGSFSSAKISSFTEHLHDHFYFHAKLIFELGLSEFESYFELSIRNEYDFFDYRGFHDIRNDFVEGSEGCAIVQIRIGERPTLQPTCLPADPNRVSAKPMYSSTKQFSRDKRTRPPKLL